MLKKLTYLSAAALASGTMFAGALAQEDASPPLMGIYSFSTTSPGSVVGALDAMMDACGDGVPAVVSVLGETFNGTDPSTHTVLFTYANAQDMMTTGQTFQSCDGAAAFYETINDVITPYSNSLGQGVMGGGDVYADQAFMVFQMAVSDEAAYAAAFAEFMQASTDAGDLPGSYGLARILTPSDGITHFAYVGASDLAELLSATDAISPANSEARAAFNDKVADIRKIKNVRVSMRVKTYTPE